MPIEPVVVPNSPCLGPYSHAVCANGFVYVSGQLGMANGELAKTVEEQTELALKNMEGVLKAAKSGLDKVVKTQVMLKDMNDFTRMNDVYAKFFTTVKPARICV